MSDSAHILKVEPKGFADRINVGSEKKKSKKNTKCLFAFSKTTEKMQLLFIEEEHSKPEDYLKSSLG